MNIKRILTNVTNVVADEAANNSKFRDRLVEALGLGLPEKREGDERKGGRRTPAVLDPIELARSGENRLRLQLESLDLQRLLDIVAQYGMDPGKLVMKWKDRERVIDRIVEVAKSRATKGDVFRSD